MLIFDRENWPHHRPWCIAIFVALLMAIGWYLAYGFGGGTWSWPAGASPPGFVYGVAGGLIILFEMLLWPRKSRWRRWRLGPTKLWMTAHLWLGILAFPLLLLHGGFHFNLARSTLSAVLMWLLVGVIVSGVYGLVVQNVLPRLMLEQVPAETIYSQIGHILDQYRAEAERLVRGTCGPSPTSGKSDGDSESLEQPGADSPYFVAVETVRQVGRTQGKVVQVGIEAVWVPDSEALRAFYQDQVEPYLRAHSGRRKPLGSRSQAAVLFQGLKTRLRPQAHHVVDRLADICDQRRQFDLQARLHLWLHSWLVGHVALSVALTFLMIVHIIIALKYL
jgi:hypothetical protein